ncbi:MAG: hypothetical protein DRR19_08065 [Candidatus Parabeggiatoa sp. nov. 1]|nr:MAG: hypothetical protein DRR19_08065 [Gammaproteobacteria bacterium]
MVDCIRVANAHPMLTGAWEREIHACHAPHMREREHWEPENFIYAQEINFLITILATSFESFA